MGCDIHFYVERKTDSGWEFVESPIPNRWWDPQSDREPRTEWYSGRNYRLFSRLADVRSSGDETPMDEPRGLPSDAGQYVAAQAADMAWDGHSHSWFAAGELAAVDWADISPEFDVSVAVIARMAGRDPHSVRAVFWFDN